MARSHQVRFHDGATTGAATGAATNLNIGAAGYGGGWESSEEEEEEDIFEEEETWLDAPEGAKFETLSDGTTALILPPGSRLKVDLSTLEEGGDAKKAERRRKAKAKEKQKSKWGGYGMMGGGGGYKSLLKSNLNSYTITMDIKVLP